MLRRSWWGGLVNRKMEDVDGHQEIGPYEDDNRL